MDTELHISILLIIVSLVRGQNNENDIKTTINETQITTKIDTINPTPSPLEKICNQTDTCQHYNEVKTNKSDYQDLRTRKCMCDEKCSMYGDCCKDSIYYNVSKEKNLSFSCERTVFDGYVYMVNKCAPDYTNNLRMIENCHTANRTMLVQNFLLTLPVTNILKQITYKNAYCAICNKELDFDFWQPIFSYKFKEPDVDIVTQNTSEPSSSNKTQYVVVQPYSIIYSNTKIDENGTELISQIDGQSYACKMIPNIPGNIAPVIRFCLSSSNDRFCSDCEKLTPTNSCMANGASDYGKIVILDALKATLPRIDSCKDIPPNISNKKIFCPEDDPIPPAPDNIDGCFFVNKTSFPCLVNSFFGPGEYQFLENGSAYVEKHHYAFPFEEYTNKTSIPNAIYVCGTVVPMSEKQKMLADIKDVSSEVLIKFSILFLLLYLITNVNKQKLQSLPNKILFSFCITLLLLYLVFEIGPKMPSCKIPAALFHYLCLSCFTWLLIASYDFWQVICRSSTKLQTLAGKTRLKRYLLYCFIGWISPLSIMAVSIYFELSKNSVIPCIYKPGYGRLNQCFIAQYIPKNYFFLYPATAMFFTIIALFAHTSYYIYLSKSKNIKSTAQNNYYMLFMKLALTMGLTWSVGIFVTYTDLELFRFIYVILNASHGTLMFFAYSFKCTMLTKVYEKHKNSSIVQQTKSTFFSITDRIRSSSSQPSTSADPPTLQMESTT